MRLEVRDVTHRLGSETVLHDVSFTVAGPALIALAGRSGSGKSTLCHLIAGLGSPSSGAILVGGQPAAGVTDWAAVSLLPQRLALVEELTITENIMLPAVLGGQEPSAMVAGLDLGEAADRRAGQASLGEQQRAALARALVLTPQVAVLDEPTGHQDDEHVEHVLSALTQARDAGTAVLVATHDERVLDVADEIIRLHRGRIV